MASSGPGNHFCGWLLGPYIDLGFCTTGPLHAQNLKQGWQAVRDPESALFHPQRAMAPGFRSQLAKEAGLPCSVSDPREIPEELRSGRWESLCGMIDGWRNLPIAAKVRLASLLHSLCFYSLIATLGEEQEADAEISDPATTDLKFWIASARYIARVPRRIADYQNADLTPFEKIAIDRGGSTRARFNATAKIFVHKAKTDAALSDLQTWAARFEESVADATADMDVFEAELHSSRYYRGMGFLPQRAGDRAGVARLMNRAETHALNMRPVTPAQHVLYRENLHALMESRTKEALAAGDLGLALQRSLKVIELDPFDSKAWVEVGQVRQLQEDWREAAQAYAFAAMLGPPAHALGRNMAGVCLRELGFDLLAASFFVETLERDPLGISPKRAIQSLPDLPALNALKEWAESRR